MLLKVLGSAAGGAFPQWNCNCPNCRRVREGDAAVRARTNNSIAVSDEGVRWYVMNATPDICLHIEQHAALQPDSSTTARGTPIAGILLTDAELDHTLGLFHLRQGAELEVYASPPVSRALDGPFPVRRMLASFAAFRWNEVRLGESFPLFGGRVTIEPFPLGGKPPRYVRDNEPDAAWVIGYRIEDRLTGGTAVYAPGIEDWTAELERHLAGADCVFADGTFWHMDELRRLGISELVAADMGHIPIAGPEGSLERLARSSARRKIYIHINNTNPILDSASSEFRLLRERGIEVGYDGLEVEV